jgi:hypothetical protein
MVQYTSTRKLYAEIPTYTHFNDLDLVKPCCVKVPFARIQVDLQRMKQRSKHFLLYLIRTKFQSTKRIAMLIDMIQNHTVLLTTQLGANGEGKGPQTLTI